MPDFADAMSCVSPNLCTCASLPLTRGKLSYVKNTWTIKVRIFQSVITNYVNLLF